MPGTPARSSMFQAVDARMIDEQMPFSENEPGREPSIAPRRIGLLRWVMAVTRMVGFGLVVAGDIAGEFGEGSLHVPFRGIELQIALDHDPDVAGT